VKISKNTVSAVHRWKYPSDLEGGAKNQNDRGRPDYEPGGEEGKFVERAGGRKDREGEKGKGEERQRSIKLKEIGCEASH